jgi:heme exporter protein C
MDGTPPHTPARGSALHRFANPGRFMRLSGALLPWCAALAVALSTTGLVWGLVFAPRDWQQGDTVRIMFLHVPAAWMAMGGYLGLAIASFMSLVWRHPLADVAARAIAPVGAVFTAICLITGSLWGRPMWGTWWVWDARLTSVLVLFFLYLGHIALSNAFDDEERAARPAAILALIGAVNLPIIKFSVDWWNTLHQPASVTRLDAPGIHIDILQPLLITAVGFLFVFAALALLRTRTGILERRARAMMAARAAEPAATASPVPV